VLENFFGGSREALLAQLGSTLQPARPGAALGQALRARAAAASASRGVARRDAVAAAPIAAASAPAAHLDETSATNEAESFSDEDRIDDTLL
jgi:hypothetical protein